MGRGIHDITGMRFGKLTAIKYRIIKHRSYWTCVCDCGNVVEVAMYDLVSGQTKSCGCIVKHVLPYSRRGWGKTGVKGVFKTKSNRYRASIYFKGESHYLGLFDTLEEAKEVRKQAEKRLFKPMIEKYAIKDNT